MPRNSSLVDSIDLNNAAAASLQCAHIGILYANSRTGRACGARGSALPAAHQPPYYLVRRAPRRRRRRRCAPPRSHEAARDLMTRARFRLERVSVSKNEQSASQACLTLQCTAFEKRPHISSFKEWLYNLTCSLSWFLFRSIATNSFPELQYLAVCSMGSQLPNFENF